MKINQVEELVGITKKNIRFYEKEGLISPRRNPENSYREYNLEDVQELKKIKLLRQLDIPIEKIRQLQNNEINWKKCIEEHMIDLNHKKHNIDMIQELNQKLLENEEELNHLNPDIYFDEMKLMEKRGAQFMNVKNKDVRRQIGPILSAIVMIIFFISMIALVSWIYTIDETTPILLPIGISILMIAFIIGVLIALKQRLKEIKGGELDEASKY